MDTIVCTHCQQTHAAVEMRSYRKLRVKVGKDERKEGRSGKPEGEDKRPEAMRLSVTKSNYLIGVKPAVWLRSAGAGWQAMDPALRQVKVTGPKG